MEANLILLGIAALNAFTAYLAFRTRGDMHTLEKNTNSIKDALVKKVDEAAEGRGRDTERKLGEDKATALAAGKLEGGVKP
jgi:hypothetical protein